MTNPPTPEELIEARLDAVALIQASLQPNDQDDAVGAIRALIRSSDQQPWQLLIAMAGLTAAVIEQFTREIGTDEFTPADYLNRLRQWILSNEGNNND